MKYAVVKAYAEQAVGWHFTKLHDSKEEAFAEAERLTQKEQTRFFVLKLIGYTDFEQAPVKREEFKEDGI